MSELLIIGGGASGIAAALSAAKAAPELSVTLAERLPRVGKKILATGNGRCNLSNADISPAHYFSSDPDQLDRRLSEMPTRRTLEFFRELGLFCAEEEEGRIYPRSRQANSVLDVLLAALRRFDIHIVCGCRAEQIRRDGDGFSVVAGDRMLHGGAVILACGGMAAPKQGTDGSGYALARALGHSVTPLYPCLTAFSCSEPSLKGLKGIRARCTAALRLDGVCVAEESGEIQFADDRLSGIPIFQLSCRWQPCTAAELSLDLLPELSAETLLRFLCTRRSAYPDEPLESFLVGLLHKRLGYAVMKQAGLAPLSRRISSLRDAELKHLCGLLKNWRLTTSGPAFWENAQVTRGGVPLDEVDDCFASRRCSGLWLTGELLDAAGECGGYNLHWAWCSGMTAGNAAAAYLLRSASSCGG